jgi:plastocyanin
MPGARGRVPRDPIASPKEDHIVTRCRRMAVLTVLAALAAAAPATAGVIRGVVRVPGSAAPAPPAMNAYPGRASALPGGRAPARGLVTDAVVYLAKIPAVAESAMAQMPGPRPQLAQQQESFKPRVVAVARGYQVDFPNRDPIYHNVFSLSPTRRFDLGKYRQGRSKTVRFDRVGLVRVYCDIHAEMEAFVLVVPNHAFAQPGTDGSFELPDLPPGAYELRAWHPDLPEIVRTVQIPAHGDARVELSFGPGATAARD